MENSTKPKLSMARMKDTISWMVFYIILVGISIMVYELEKNYANFPSESVQNIIILNDCGPIKEYKFLFNS